MRLYLEIKEGLRAGQKITLTRKTSIGRRDADIVLDDPKLSGFHAVFDYSEDTGWVVIDQKSRNGVWVNGMREVRHVISDRDQIQMGSIKMQCRILDENNFKLSESFRHSLQGLYKKSQNHPLTHMEIKPEIRLQVVQGIQYGDSWTIFYGPRKAGKNSDDIRLYDSAAPEKAFEIHVKGKYAYFYTEHENIVQLNKQAIKEKQFQPGDRISFGECEILVEVDEGYGFSP